MRFDMGKAWEDAVEMLSGNREVMLVVSGVFFFLPAFAFALAIPAAEPPIGGDEAAMQRFLVEFYSSIAPVYLLLVLAQAIGSIALIALLRDDSKPTVGQAIRIGALGIFPYIGVQLLVGLGAGILFLAAVGAPAALGVPVLAVVLGMLVLAALFYVMVKLSLVTPVIAIEKVMNPIRIIERSWKLTKGNSPRLLGFYLLIGVVFVVASLLSGLVVSMVAVIAGQGSTAASVVNGIVSGAIGALGTMVFTAIIAAVHRQLAGPSTGRLDETFR